MVIWEHVRLMQRPGASSKFVGQDPGRVNSWTAINVLAVIFPDERRAEWKHLVIDARFLIDFDTFFEIVEEALEDSTKTSEDV